MRGPRSNLSSQGNRRRNAILESDVIISSSYSERFSLNSSVPSLFRQLARFALISCSIVGALSSVSTISAQTDNSPFPQPTQLQQGPPLTNQEFVRMLYQLPANPGSRDRLMDDIRKRGIAFPITPGLRSLVATKSGND